MSLEETRQQLARLLDEKDDKIVANVIALSGKWGTGKTRMWRDLQEASSNDLVKNALYASLFGLSSIDQVKARLMQSVVPMAEKYPSLWDGAKKAMRAGITALEDLHPAFSALDNVALLFAPKMFRQKLIVLDDIERMHASLHIDEVLGFIDEFSQQHDTRFLLILNTERLQQHEAWETLREKVIDQELRLNTSSREAFGIAIASVSSDYADPIREAVEICELTNIRVIRKVIKVVNRLLDGHQNLTSDVIARVVPSVVLLSAIHYRGIEDGPDFDFVLSQHGPDWSEYLADDQSEDSEAKRREANWKLLLRKLRLIAIDDLELLIVEFLQSGLFDPSQIREIIDRYTNEAEGTQALHACREFLERVLWDHRRTEDQLALEAKGLITTVHLLDAAAVTALYDAVNALPDGKTTADRMLSNWIAGFREREVKEVNTLNFLGPVTIHPQIRAEYLAINERAQARTTVMDAVETIRSGGWGTREEVVMKSATVADMAAAIRTDSIPQLQQFMYKMLDICNNRNVYAKHFGSAAENFLEACRQAARDTQSPRLAKLIRTLFASANLASELPPQ